MPAKTFKYKKVAINQKGASVLRPLVPIEILKLKKSIKYEVLIDTGADFCIFSGELAELLGIDIKSGEQTNIVGVGGYVTVGYIHKIGITIPGFPTYNSWAFFSNDLNDQNQGILGQKGFFEHFKVTFDYTTRKIVIRK